MARLQQNGFSLGPPLSPAQCDRLWMVGLSLLALWLLTFQLGSAPIKDWDEGLVAQVAKEIYRAGAGTDTWLFPTLNGLPYWNKPPLLHNLIALADRWGGVNEWTARLPGSLITACSAPLLYQLARELYGKPCTAGLAGLVYLTSLPVIRHGRMAMLDGVLVTEFLLLLVCLVKARRDLRWALGIGLGFGLMGLTKGAIALVLGAIALVFIGLDTPRLLTSGFLWLGLGLGSFPLGAWYGAQFAQYGREFWQVHVLGQSVGRLWTGVEKNTGSPLYYLMELLKYSAPWLFFLPQGLWLACRDRAFSGAKLSLIWFVSYLAIISAMGTKLPWYALPLYPAIALLVAPVLSQAWNAEALWGVEWNPIKRYPREWILGMGLTAIAAGGSCVYFAIGPQPQPVIAVLLVLLTITLVATTGLLWRRNPQFLPLLFWGLILSLTGLIATPLWLWELGEAYPVQPVADLLRQHTPPQEVIFTNYPYNRPSLNFYSDRIVIPKPLAELPPQGRAATYLLLDAAGLQRLTPSLAPSFPPLPSPLHPQKSPSVKFSPPATRLAPASSTPASSPITPPLQSLGSAQGWTLVLRPPQPNPAPKR